MSSRPSDHPSRRRLRLVAALGPLLVTLGATQSGDAVLRTSEIALVRTQAPAARPVDPQSSRVAERIRQALDAALLACLATSASPEHRDLAAFYEGGGKSAWIDADGRPSGQARVGLTLLGQALDEGLDPADYGAAELARQSAALERVGRVEPTQAAAFEVGLSAALLRYARHISLGKVDQQTIGGRTLTPAVSNDFPARLRAALAADRLSYFADDVAPPLSQYRALRSTLARYRALAAAETPADIPRPADTVRPGDVVSDIAVLHRRLVAIGDLPADLPLPADGRYDDTLSAAVMRFQQRHGLVADGVIGRATTAALAVPLAWRVRQIEMALERLRWLSELGSGRTIAVNIPMYRLWVWDRDALDAAPVLSMPVIVGRALDTPTPVLAGSLEHVIFRPYWNVPTSILRDELLPILRRDPAYLSREDMEIVAGPGDAAPVLPATAENISRLGTDGGRLRQRPGPKNALGLVKFVFPNDANVYMHDTPAPHLFRQARRDLSHGCIRVADPVALAEWVLGPDAWTRDRLLNAMSGDRTVRADLQQPVQVVIIYTTAFVAPREARVLFADDVYGQDEWLDAALRRALPRAHAPGIDMNEVR